MALKKDPEKCQVEKPMFITVLFSSRVKGGQSTSMTAKLAGKVPAAWIPTWVGRLATFAQNERKGGPSGTISNVQYPCPGVFMAAKPTRPAKKLVPSLPIFNFSAKILSLHHFIP